MKHALIIGGGISGLSSAYYLNKAGIPFTLIEKASHLGGLIKTEHMSGCTLEAGPDSFLSSKPWALELIEELGLGSEVIGSKDEERETFIVKNGSLVPLPDGMQFMIPRRIGPMLNSSLVGLGSKLQMGMEWFRKPTTGQRPERSVAEFVKDHFGEEALEYIAEPLMAGVYGGVPEQLSATSVFPKFVEIETKYGSLRKGSAENDKGEAPPSPLFKALQNGMGSLIDGILGAIAENIKGVRGTAEAVEQTGYGFRVKVNDDWVEGSDVIMACEAHNAQKIVAQLNPRLSALFGEIPYSSSVIMTIAFDARDLAKIPQGFGFLVPRRERKRIMACTFVGNKFPYREADNIILLRVFMGGPTGADAIEMSEGTLLEEVMGELNEILDITAKPQFTRLWRLPNSMPQYTVGHEARVAEIEEHLKAMPGLHVVGNAYYGIGIPNCVKMAREIAGSIVERHRQPAVAE